MTAFTDFTQEETNLIATYMPKENKVALIRAMVKDVSFEEDKELLELASSSIDKLAKLKDEDYLKYSFLEAL